MGQPVCGQGPIFWPGVGQLTVLCHRSARSVVRALALRHAGADQAGQHIAGATNGQVAIARGVDARRVPGRGDHGA